jgi:hypothetical protein
MTHYGRRHREMPDWLVIALMILAVTVFGALMTPLYGWLLAMGWGWAK